jgi:tRNA threonylcarbamoyladenosine biosynthesis protein TsaB
MPVPSASALRFLAIESSTDTLSIAVGSGLPGEPMWTHTGPGSAQASITLLPQVRSLLGQAGWPLQTLDAVVFARGPGSFTGLRTACAVAQGLAYGTQALGRQGGLPVLAVDTLLALADEACHQWQQAQRPLPRQVVALLDARMGELYVAVYACSADTGLQALAPARLCAPQDLGAWLAATLPSPTHPVDGTALLLAGNVFAAYPNLMPDLLAGWGVPNDGGSSAAQLDLLPTATALLRLAPGLLAAGAAVAAQDALPLYVRDKVAQTTAERERLRTALPTAAT